MLGLAREGECLEVGAEAIEEGLGVEVELAGELAEDLLVEGVVAGEEVADAVFVEVVVLEEGGALCGTVGDRGMRVTGCRR